MSTMTFKPRDCTKCGAAYSPSGGNQRKCDKCRAKAPGGGYQMKECDECGNLYTPTAGNQRVCKWCKSMVADRDAATAKAAAAAIAADKAAPAGSFGGGGPVPYSADWIAELREKYKPDSSKRRRYEERWANHACDGDIDAAQGDSHRRRIMCRQQVEQVFVRNLGADITQEIWPDIRNLIRIVLPAGTEKWIQAMWDE